MMRIRACKEEECALVLALWQETGATPTSTDYLEDVVRFVREHPDLLLVAVDSSRILGSILVGWDGWRAGIYRLAVLPTYRRRGIGRAMVEEAERRLLAKGARRLSVLVERHDAQAVAFWDALASEGYGLDPRMVRYVKSLRDAPL